MKRRLGIALLALFAYALLPCGTATAYPVGPAVSLETMTQTADLVVKARVIGSAEVKDPSFRDILGFKVAATRFQVISVLKGVPGHKEIEFRHYTGSGVSFQPQFYEFSAGRSYIVFARRTEDPDVFRPLWESHTAKQDQGALRAADEKDRTGMSVQDAVWTELTALLAGADADDAIYAINQLNEMSGGAGGLIALQDFERQEVAAALRPLLSAKDEKVAAAAINAVGSRNPCMDSNKIMWWLITVGHGRFPGMGKGNPHIDNVSGRLLWKDLEAVADSQRPASLRAQAVRALGRTGLAEIRPALARWAGDPQPLVRQAAIVVLAVSAGEDARPSIEAAVIDDAAEARQGAAQAIGIVQNDALLPLLAKLLKDESAIVRDAAALSLLSFPIVSSRDILRQHRDDPEYRSVFINALAAADASPYVHDLEEIIARKLKPTRFWGGMIPAGDSWDLLFKHVQSRPVEELRSGKLDTSLDALEKLDWYGSSEPRDLYALYLQRGLAQRAAAFREKVRKQVSYDIDHYFDMVDAAPQTYQRQ